MPARLVVYYVIALALFYGEAYEEVMRKMISGLRFVCRLGTALARAHSLGVVPGPPAPR